MSPENKQFPFIEKLGDNLISLGIWISTIALPLLLPIPLYGLEDDQSIISQLIVTIGGFFAGFNLIVIHNIKGKKFWFIYSLIIFALFIFSYYEYYSIREERTREYDQELVVIGEVLKKGVKEELTYNNLTEDSPDILDFVGGDPHEIWTSKSIKRNWELLILMYTLSYCLFAVFLTSFVNTIKVNIKKNDEE